MTYTAHVRIRCPGRKEPPGRFTGSICEERPVIHLTIGENPENEKGENNMFHAIIAFLQKLSHSPEARPYEDLRSLRKWEDNLRKREAVHAKKAKELENHRLQQEACYQELAACSKEMDVRQAELELRQNQLDKREASVALQLDCLEKSITRYCHERALWQQQKPHSGYPPLDDHVDRLGQTFRTVRNDFGAVQNNLVRLMDQVQLVQNQGIEELCWLHRDAAVIPTEESQRFAARLCVILRECFGAEPIEPVPGDCFDSTICESESSSGRTVTACIHRGWKWNGGVFRAKVSLE